MKYEQVITSVNYGEKVPKKGFLPGKPMTGEEFKKLRPGDMFWVYWAKDHNPEDIRFNGPERVYEVYEEYSYVLTEYKCGPGDQWEFPEDDDSNEADTSRGVAYYFHVEPA